MASRLSIGLAVALALIASIAEAGQAPAGEPRIDAGVGLAATAQDDFGAGSVTFAGRINIDARNGLAVSFDRTARGRDARYNDSLDVAYRRVFHRFARGQVAGTAGIGRTATYEHFVSPYGFRYPTPGYQFEYTSFEHHVFATTGLEVDLQVAPRVTLQSGFRFGISGYSPSFRASTGLMIALGPASGVPADRTPRAARFGEITRGQQLWVTTDDGTEIAGEAVSVSGRELTVVRGRAIDAVPVSRIRHVETTDRVRDGAWTGLAVGAPLGAVIFGTTCGCDEYTIFAVFAGAGLGGGIGTMAGLFADSMHKGRRVIYDASPAPRQIAVAPIVGRERLGVGGAIRW